MTGQKNAERRILYEAKQKILFMAYNTYGDGFCDNGYMRSVYAGDGADAL